MSKRIFTLFVVFVGVVFCLFISTSIMAQNTVDVDQIGALNTSTIYQAGTNQAIDIDQSTANNNDVYVEQDGGDSSVVIVNQMTTGGDNNANVEQEDGVDVANEKSVNVIQTAVTGNDLVVDQAHAGGDTSLTVNQTATTGYNDADVMQAGDAVFGSNTVINQTGTYNELDVWEDLDSGGESNTYLNQTAASYNDAYIETDADSAGANTLTEALADGSVGGPGAAASQISGSFNDFYWVSYDGDSEFGLTQTALDDNYADLYQDGGVNSAGVYQDAGSWNWALIDQTDGSNSLTLAQAAGTTNIADIVQNNGGNFLGASQDAGTYNVLDTWQQGGDSLTLAQFAGTYNDVLLTQAGGLNEALVNQDASEHNLVDIDQYGGGNFLMATQTTASGFNQLTVEQAGGMTATVDQNSATNNIATVTQL